jgi:hypothetical protein
MKALKQFQVKFQISTKKKGWKEAALHKSARCVIKLPLIEAM